MRVAVVAATSLVAVGCATMHTRAPTATCTTAPMSWTPRTWPSKRTPYSKLPCVRDVPTEGADRVRFGRDLDEALYCVELYYRGPDGLPIDAMLKGALDALVKVYPDARRVAVHAIGDQVDSIETLTRTLLRVAFFTRTSAVGVDPAPEDVLLKGALSALAWWTDFKRPPFDSFDEKKAESFTAIAKDSLVYVRAGEYYRNGIAARFRRELSWHSLSGVILDLRGSTGGLLAEALAITDLFTRTGCLVVTRPPVSEAPLIARDQDFDVDMPLVVLVDRQTSSGSELIAATLRARGRAAIIGEKTAGKALVHTLIQLSSGTRMRLPLAELLAGDGTPFDHDGVEPDVTLPASFEPDRGADRAIDFAKAVIRQSRGMRRDDLLQTARQMAAITR